MAARAPRRSRPPVITLTTDFGLQDNFVGVMKGVIASIAPEARVIDLSHAVPPQDVATGAFVLATGFAYFPPGTVHVAIVDPGVGSERRAIALEAGGYRWVAPDNGLLGFALATLAAAGHAVGRWEAGWWECTDDARAVVLAEPRYWLPRVSRTFHGRDVFAPVAAHLARGVPLTALGPSTPRIRALRLPSPEPTPDGWRGQVIYVDRFGNLITNVTAHELGDADWRVHVGDATIDGLSPSYAAMPGLGAIVGSSGHLEIAAPRASAQAALRTGVGAAVVLERRPGTTASDHSGMAVKR